MSFRYRLFIVVPALLGLVFLLAGPGMYPVLALRLSYTADEVS